MNDPLYVAIAIFLKDISENQFKFWMQVRDEEGPFKGKWEFPGGKIEVAESPEDAAKREVNEEVGLRLQQMPLIKPFKTYDYQYPERIVKINSFVLPAVSELDGIGQWFTAESTSKPKKVEVNTLEANFKIISDLGIYLSEESNRNHLWQS